MRTLSAFLAAILPPAYRGRAAIALLAVCLGWRPCLATFHLMQIEQVIGGVSGDTTAQAIQLRMRTAGQNLVSGGRIRVWDAAGLNPVLVIDLTTDVLNGAAGDRVLVCSAAFKAKTTPTTVPDFTMTNLIPASYLAAGRLTWEDDLGTILWSLAWGGAAYTGPNNGSTFNDVNGNYGPPFAGPCPSTSLQALRFTGAAGALSTSNSLQYALTSGVAVFTSNARTSFTITCTSPSVQQPPASPGTVHVGDPVSFSVTASGSATLTYAWRRDGSPLSDDGRITGSATATLSISSAAIGDTGTYDVVVTNPCGNVTSDGASMAVFCFADFDHNLFVNGDDFDEFSLAFFNGDPSADVDGNGFVNGDDFDAFSLHFDEGC